MRESCPDIGLLRRLLEDDLDAHVEPGVLGHLEGCAECRERVVALPGGTDLFVESHVRPARARPESWLSPGDLPAERELIGEFRITREIGRGGMGIVYEAEQQPLGRRVALKVLPSFGLLDRTLVERFRREARTAAGLHHTNIVPVHGAGEHRGLHYYAMEFIDGQGLDRVIRDLRKASGSSDSSSGSRPSSGLPSPSVERSRFYHRVAELGAQAADGLAYAHAHGVVHRDIKPSNLLLDRSSIVWIADFGLARAAASEQLTRTGDVLGTIAYMPPERFAGVSDERGDIYSLGMTIYELLTLRPAFADSDRHRLIKRVTDEEPAALRSIDSSISRDLETIVLKSIQKEPASRYREASRMADDLRRFLEDRPIRARRATVIERGWRWCRRNRAITALLLCVAAVSIIAAVAAWISVGERELRVSADLRSRSDQSFSQAQRLFGDGRYDDALAEVGQSLELRPSIEGQLLQARLLFATRKRDAAARVLETLLVDNPSYGAAHSLLAAIYRGRDRARSAFHQESAERLLEDSADALYLRALGAPDVNESLEWLERAWEIDPSHHPAARLRAVTRLALRDYERMEADARVAVALRPRDPYDRSLLALAATRLGKPESALIDLDAGIEVDPDYPTLFSQRREVHRLLGNREAELADARRAVELRDGGSYFYLVGALLHSGLFDEARRLWTSESGSSWKKRESFRRALARRVFDDEQAGVDFMLPESETGELLEDVRRYRSIYRDVSRKARRLVRNTFRASLSPDGARIAYDSRLYADLDAEDRPGARNPRTIHVLDIESGETRLRVQNGKDASWSPDGRWITFVRQTVLNDGRHDEVWIVPAAGGAPRRLATGVGFPSWSSDPRRVYVQARQLDQICEIVLDDPESKLRPIAECIHPYPSISPDGRFYSASVDGELAIVEIATGAIVERWRPPTRAGELLTSWSPDGRQVSLGSVAKGELGLWIYDRRSGSARHVVRGPATLGTWSQDGRSFVFTIRGSVLEAWFTKLEPGKLAADLMQSARTVEDWMEVLVEETRQIVARNPQSARYRRNLARALRGAKRFRESAVAFRAAFDLSTGAVATDLFDAAESFKDAGDHRAAARALEDGLVAPNRPIPPHRMLSRLFRFPTYRSIDVALTTPVPLVPQGTTWSYLPGEEAVPDGWTRVQFDDSSWPVGHVAAGFGRRGLRTRLRELRGRTRTVYLRRAFELPGADAFAEYHLSIVIDDGYVAWLNGVEIARRRAGDVSRTVHHDDSATSRAPRRLVRERIDVPREVLRSGRNVLAVVALSADDEDLVVSPAFFGGWPRRGLSGRFRKFSSMERDEDVLRKQEYLRARRHQRAGRVLRALGKLRTVVEKGELEPEPSLRAAECLRELGDFQSARELVRGALERDIRRRRELWEIWWSLSVIDSSLPAETVLRELPEAPGDRSPSSREFRDLLQGLTENGTVRINCGGDESIARDGETWLADAWFTSGFRFAGDDVAAAPTPFAGRVSGTDDAPLYRTERWYSHDYESHFLPDGYRIPLPPGSYRVTLHFAEIVNQRAGLRIFDVLVENRLAIEALDILARVGYATPLEWTVEPDVRDGFLDIEFVRSRGDPKVSAIEIRRVDSR